MELPDKLRVGLLQWPVKRGDFAFNFSRVTSLLDNYGNEGFPHIVAFPEMWSCGFCGKALLEEAESFTERVAELSKLAIRHQIWIVAGSIPEPFNSDKVFNTLLIVDSRGEVRSKYRKLHLFPNSREPEFFEPGTEPSKIVTTGNWKIGASICFDLRFPEIFRYYYFQGANLIFNPAQFPSPKRNGYTFLEGARAIENQVVFATINRTGTDGSMTYFGGSNIFNEVGELIKEAGGEEELCVGEVNFSSLLKHRMEFDFKDSLASCF
jgi:predicted amidohydrolase